MEEFQVPPSFLVVLATSRTISRPLLLPALFDTLLSPDMGFWRPVKAARTVAADPALETQSVLPATAALVLYVVVDKEIMPRSDHTDNFKGYCGTSKDHCSAPDCLIDFGPACDANKTPGGASTRNDARPQKGNVPYGGEGIYVCQKPGTVAITYDDG